MEVIFDLEKCSLCERCLLTCPTRAMGLFSQDIKGAGLMPDPVVAVALSGGIDSLAAGFLVRQQFKEVFGIHFTTGYEKNALDISKLETMLGFKVHLVDLSRGI